MKTFLECVDSLGNVVDKNITDVGYHELSTYHLRAGTGSLHETITACTVPTLQEVVAKISGQTLLLLDGAWDFRDEVYDMLVSNNALNSVVFLASGDKSEVDDWLSSKSTMPLVISSYHGNVVFSARSTVSRPFPRVLSAHCCRPATRTAYFIKTASCPSLKTPAAP